MKKIYFSLITAFFFVTAGFAQVTVTGADAATNAGSPYSTLKAAFDNINLASQAGNTIVITVTGTTTETAQANLIQSSGPWTSLRINPVGVASVTGNFLGGVISLTGADNVTIDGLNTGGNSLAIDNPNTGNASAIRFINDATNNTIIDCNLLGSTATAASAVVFFGGGATTTGNDNNTITECNISASSGGTPINGILSVGTSAVLDNSNNTISTNNISDYFSATSGAVGVNANTNSSGWTITSNTFYQTATRTDVNGSTYHAIWVTAGSGYTINFNVIGYAAPNATGTTNMIGLASGSLGGTFPSSFTPGGTSSDMRFTGITCSFTAGGTVSSIQGNIIGGIAIYTGSGASTTNGILCGIQVISGNANIGTVTGNTIGSATGTNSIYAASSFAGGGAVISGIYCTTNNTISIQNNIIGGIDASGISATTGIGFKGIEGAGTGTYTIGNNYIGSTAANNIRTGYLLTGGNLSNVATTPTSATGGAAVQGIVGSSTGTSMSITGNTIRGIQISGSNSPFTGINTTGAVTGSIDVSNNNLGTTSIGLINIMFANSSGILCMNNSGGSASCAYTANNNIFQGVNYAAEGSGSFRCLNNSAALLSCTMNNNNFNNLTVNTTGSTFGFLIGATSNTPTVTLNGNYVTTQFSNITLNGAVNYFAFGCATPILATGSTTITNNNLSNITFRTTTSLGAAIYWTNGNVAGSTHNINISNNVVSNLTNNGTAGTAALYGIVAGFGNTNVLANNTVSGLYGKAQTIGIAASPASLNAAGSFTVNNNTVYNINSSTASSQAQGIQCAAGPTQNIFKNKIYDITCTGAGVVIGLIETSGTAGTTANIYNNIIGRLYAPNSGFFQAVRGITFGSSVANTANLYYNTVYLDGNCPGNSYCVYMNSATPTFNLRNNIFVNNATPTGGLEQMAIFRTGALTATYATTSDNNILYAGTPGPLHLIYGDGAAGGITNAQQTLAGFQAFVTPRETNSKTELPPFLNTTTGIGGQYLHLNPAIATQAESGAVNIATYTDDFDAEIRQGNGGYIGTGTAPDIGADEIQLLVDKVTPDISFTALSNTTCLTNPTFTATITDYSGINTVLLTKPRVYYKTATNSNSLGGTNTNTTDGWKYVEASNSSSPFSFTIDYSLIFGGVVAGANIQYFVTAQDLAITPNVGINSGTFASTPLTVALTGAAFPISGLINNYDIRSAIPTSITIGAAGTYTSLTGINGLFADINSKGLSANTVANIIDASVTETGLFSLYQMANGCGLGNYTLTIKPNAAGTTLTGSLANGPLIKIRSSNVIIDGSSNGSSSQDLTITNTSVTAPNVVLLGSNGTTSISNSTLKNCIVINGVNTSSAVVVSDGLTPATIGYFNNITIQNNNIQRAYTGIFAIAALSSGNGSGLNITSNSINTSGANAIRLVGVYVQGVDGATVSGNDIGNFETASDEIDRGIWFATGSTNSVIEKNNIHDLQYTGTAGNGTKGISISTGLAAANVTVRNNMISGMTGDGDDYISFGATYSPVGIHVFGTGQGGIFIYYNTIHLYGATLNFAAASLSLGIALDNNSTATIKNNIVHNELGLLAANGIGASCIGAYTSASQFIALDYNDYYSNPASGLASIGNIFNSFCGSLACWQGQVGGGREVNSLGVKPNFTSASDLHLVASTNCRLDGYGTPIAGITTDYDVQTRDAGAPDMGADEFTTTPAPSTMTTASNCDTKNVSPLGTNYIDGTCNLIARVLPSGGAAVSGKIKTCSTLDGTQQTHNAQPYVQRHYDIEPSVNATTATGTITLYFTDAEFDLYNTTNPVWPKLPTMATGGNASIYLGNVKVTQFHGVGSTNPTHAGNYPGTAVLITPVTPFFNGTYWQITFNVTGFSGFYVHTNNFNAPLPISINYFTGVKQGSNHLLNWKVTCNSTPSVTMTLERSESSTGGFTGINTINATAARCNQPFNYTDAQPLKGMNYYRLKMLDADGKISYSSIVALLNAVKGFDIVSIAPNPVVNDNFILNVSSAQASKMELTIIDMQGRLVKRQTVSVIAGFNSLPVNVANLSKGTYTIYGTVAEDKSRVIRFVKQ